MSDNLGDRMKGQYENRTRFMLPRRTYTVIRVDGRAFHSYTRGLQRPYDIGFMDQMDATAKALCEDIQGAKLAFVQSDEISVIATDFDGIQTEAWFDGNVQKIASLSASCATAHFNQDATKIAYFDGRCFTIPDPVEVENYLIWRQQDATRNSILMTGQVHFSHKEMQGKTCDMVQEMLFSEKGINWNDQPVGFKRGRCVVRNTHEVPIEKGPCEGQMAMRSFWDVVEPPIFTQDRAFITYALAVKA